MPARFRVPSWALVAVSTVLAAVLAPAALGDHAYSHRYYVVGRVVDAAHEPVFGAEVRVVLVGVPVGPCHGDAGGPAATTKEGDFRVCFHAHRLPDDARVVVNVSGEVVEVDADARLRKTVVLHELANASDRKDAGAVQFFPQRYHVHGRAWRETGPILVEGQPADGDVQHGERVNVTLTFNEGRSLVVRAITDAFGDYRAEFTLDEPLESGTVTVEGVGLNVTVDSSLGFRRSDVDLVAPLPEEKRLQQEFERRRSEEPVDPPGTRTPAPAGAWVALALADAAVTARRRGER